MAITLPAFNTSAVITGDTLISQTDEQLNILMSDVKDYVEAGYNTVATSIENNVSANTILAEKWASEAENIPVLPGKYSAYHWAQQAASTAVGTTSSGGYAANVYLTALTATTNTSYKKLSYSPDEVATDLNTTVNNSELLLAAYIFDGDVSASNIPSGEWGFHFHAKVDTAVGDSRIKFEIYKRSAAGVETVLFSKLSNEINNLDYELITILITKPIYTVAQTDRLGLKVYANTTRTGNVNISMLIGNGSAAYFNTPLEIRHNQLRARTENDAHPVSAITGLQTVLDAKVDNIEVTTIATANKLLKLNDSSQLPASITGNAVTATILQTARTIGTSGDVTSTATSFNGSANITIPLTLANSGATAGTYKSVTVDAKGRVTAGTNPSTISGYGITDAYTKTEVDAIAQGLNAKASVVVASTTNIVLNTATPIIDGIALTASDRVLLKDQTTQAQNGIYTGLTTTTWTRTTDANTTGELKSAFIFVDKGTANADTAWVQTNDIITLGTTPITWVKFAGAGAYAPVTHTHSAVDITNGILAVAQGGTGVSTSTGSGSNVLSTSPTLVTPNIGVATGTSFNNITGLASVAPLMDGTATIGTSTLTARQDHVHESDTSKLSLSGGVLVGPITTTTPVKQTEVTLLTSAPINIPEVTLAENTFSPILHAKTNLSSGYRKHISVGSYRGANNSWAGGLYIAQGGSDSNPTEYFLLGQGGKISHSSGSVLLSGNASTATKLATGKTIAITGDLTWTSPVFDGSTNVTSIGTLANTGVTAGSYTKVTVDAKGRVTAGLIPTMEDIPDATFKRSVRCATTANLASTYLNNVLTMNAVGVVTIDGITIALNDRVLIKDQTATLQNGVYYVSTLGTASVSGVFTRAIDTDTSSKIASALVAVDSGTINGGKLFDNDFKTTDTLGTTAMTWNMNLDDGALLTSGSTNLGIVKYNGTTALDGGFDGGTTTPITSTRLNYGGYFYPTYLNLVGSIDTTTASSHVFVETDNDGFVRPKTLANFKTEMFTSPTLVTPNIGVATGTSFNSISGLSSTSPNMDGTATVGTGTTVARADHVHPSDTTKAGLASPTFTGIVVLPATTSIGAITSTELGYLSGVTGSVQVQFNNIGTLLDFTTALG